MYLKSAQVGLTLSLSLTLTLTLTLYLKRGVSVVARVMVLASVSEGDGHPPARAAAAQLRAVHDVIGHQEGGLQPLHAPSDDTRLLHIAAQHVRCLHTHQAPIQFA